jgi:hypothetical protein
MPGVMAPGMAAASQPGGATVIFEEEMNDKADNTCFVLVYRKMK